MIEFRFILIQMFQKMELHNSIVTSNESLSRSRSLYDLKKPQSSVKVVKLRAEYFFTLIKSQEQSKNKIDHMQKQLEIVKKRLRKCQRDVKSNTRTNTDIEKIIQQHYLSNHLKKKSSVGQIRQAYKYTQDKKGQRQILNLIEACGKNNSKERNSSVSQATSIKVKNNTDTTENPYYYESQKNKKARDRLKTERHCSHHGKNFHKINQIQLQQSSDHQSERAKRQKDFYRKLARQNMGKYPEVKAQRNHRQFPKSLGKIVKYSDYNNHHAKRSKKQLFQQQSIYFHKK